MTQADVVTVANRVKTKEKENYLKKVKKLKTILQNYYIVDYKENDSNVF